MNTNILILSIVALACASLAAGADVDCNKRPPKVDPKECCPMPNLVTDEYKEKCKQYEMPDPSPMPMSGEADDTKSHPRPHHHHPHHSCFMSCVLNETGIIVNSKLNEDNLKKYLSVALKDSAAMIPVMEESFKTCAAKGEEFKANMEQRMKDNPRPSPSPSTSDRMMRQPRCPPGAGMMMGCVFMNTFNNCAPSIWKDTQECNDWREFMNNCKPPHGRGGPGGKRGPGGPRNSMENNM